MVVHLLSEYEKQEPCGAIVSSVMAVIIFSMTGHEHRAQQQDLLKSSMLQARLCWLMPFVLQIHWKNKKNLLCRF